MAIPIVFVKQFYKNVFLFFTSAIDFLCNEPYIIVHKIIYTIRINKKYVVANIKIGKDCQRNSVRKLDRKTSFLSLELSGNFSVTNVLKVFPNTSTIPNQWPPYIDLSKFH